MRARSLATLLPSPLAIAVSVPTLPGIPDAHPAPRTVQGRQSHEANNTVNKVARASVCMRGRQTQKIPLRHTGSLRGHAACEIPKMEDTTADRDKVAEATKAV
jgi:hypothetical protein